MWSFFATSLPTDGGAIIPTSEDAFSATLSAAIQAATIMAIAAADTAAKCATTCTTVHAAL